LDSVVEKNLSAASVDVMAEPDLTPLMCIYCQTEMEPEGEPWPEVCPNCHRPLDLQTQFAYARGRDAFIYGQEILIKLSPKLRRKNLTTETEMEGLYYYTQAYSSLQLAFQGQLAEPQRRLGIEIMAAMTLIFQQHGTISPMEASYWRALMTELTMQIERAEVEEMIANTQPGISSIFIRLRWQGRLKQLDRSLKEINITIKRLERLIGFVEPPRARRRSLPKVLNP
jgi:hypothetical protein